MSRDTEVELIEEITKINNRAEKLANFLAENEDESISETMKIFMMCQLSSMTGYIEALRGRLNLLRSGE